MNWINATLMGSLAAAVATVTIAFVGLAMLSGRLQARDAARVVLGCFILFGAPAMVAGLMASLRDGNGAATLPIAGPPPSAPPPALPLTPPSYDPYAGASLPQ